MIRAAIIMLVAFLIALDQFTKWLAETQLPMQQVVDIMPFFALYRTHNFGIAFSMLESIGDTGLVVMAIVVMALVLFLWSRVEKHRWLSHLGFALIISGALGNVIDRALFGYVIDFFLFHTETWSFAIFNVADIYINIGAAAIILDEILAWRRQSNAAQQASNNDK